MMRRSGGFSIVEMVVVTIVVIGLMALGVNLYLGHQARGLDQVAETSLQRVAGVAATRFAVVGAYSDDPAAYVYLPEGIILVKSPQASTGITKGCNPPANTRFCPEDPVTRGQMAAFLVRALDLPPASGGFTDTRNSVFAADIAALANAGVTRGCNPPRNDRFCPEDFVTRGQMAAFLVRAGLTD